MWKAAALAALILSLAGPAAPGPAEAASARKEAAAPSKKPGGAKRKAAAKPAPAVAPRVLPLDAPRLGAAQARLGLNLINALQAERRGEQTVLVSPASLASVMALLDLGADEPMRAAVHDVLALDSERGLDAAADLDALRGTVAALSAGEGGPLRLASLVVFDPASKPYELALLGLRAKGAEARVEDLSTQGSVDAVNAFVSGATRGLVPAVLDRPVAGAGLVAVNALHFKDRWRRPFDPARTTKEPFEGVDGLRSEVAMMHAPSSPVMMRQDDSFIAAELPYATAGYALVLVTTKGKPGRARDFAGAVTWLDGSGFAEKPAEVALPRFALAEGADLLAAADRLGLKPARLSASAYRGLSPAPQRIASIVQKSVIAVDESGTEAAAATAVVTARSLDLQPLRISFNKPFLFALREQATGLVLMLGYVADPAAAEGRS